MVSEPGSSTLASSMAANGNSTVIPIFKGENYDFWSIKIETLFRSQELWDLVESGISESEEDEAKRRESKKKDAKALFFIQQGLHESVFTRISDARSAKAAWSKLKEEYQGSARIRKVRLQSLRRDFETLFMQEDEGVQDFMMRGKAIVNQMKAFGEDISEELVVTKILRSLTHRFDHVVAAIEEANDLEVLSFDALMGSLLAHEHRMNRSIMRMEEKAFQAKATNESAENRGTTGRGRGRSSRGKGRGRGWTDLRKCYACGKPRHFARDCKAGYAEEAEEEVEEENYLFMAVVEDDEAKETV